MLSRGGTGGRTHGGSGKPTGSDNRAETRDRQQAKPGQQSSRATYTSADTSTFTGSFCPIIDAVTVMVNLLSAVVPIVRIVSDDADIRMRNARRFEPADGLLSVGV